MKPPFFGTKIIADIKIEDVEKFLDLEILFASRWQLRQGVDAETWNKIRSEKAEPLFTRFMTMFKAQNIVNPQVVYGHFKCEKQDSSLIVEGQSRSFRFDFPRERETPHRSVADFFESGFITIQLATVGNGVAKIATDKFKKGLYTDVFYIKGLAAELAEATASYAHMLIRKELNVSDDVGLRFSPGYPAFPDLLDQKKIFVLLEPARIGVTLTSTCHMVPEYSTSAIISIDPQATYFRP